MSKDNPAHQEVNDFPKLAKPAQRALASAGYVQLEQLTKVTEAELSKLHGLGPHALARIRNALKSKGLFFAKASAAGKVTINSSVTIISASSA